MLLPQTDGDYANFITSLMDSQHKMLQQVHGVDSPQVALSSSMIDLQSTVSSSVPLCLLSASACPMMLFNKDPIYGMWGHDPCKQCGAPGAALEGCMYTGMLNKHCACLCRLLA